MGTIYCCKKCVDGQVKKVQTLSPCAGDSIPCSDGRNPCAGGGGGGGGDTGGTIIYVRETEQCPPGYDDLGLVGEEGGGGEGEECIRERDECMKRERDPEEKTTCEEEFARCMSGVMPPGKNRKCKKKEAGKGNGGTTECPEGKGETYEGCPCGKTYATTTGKCVAGYVFVSRSGTGWKGYKEGAIGRCECQKRCLDIGYADDCVTYLGKNGGGEFKWGGDVQGLLKRLLERANYLLDYPRGLTDEERQALQNRAFESIKSAERPALQSSKDTLARMGLLGSGFELGESDRIRRQTRQMLAGTSRDIAIEDAQKRFDQLMATTGMAQSLTGTGMTAEQMIEALNAARRGEGKDYMQMLLQYLSTLMGGQGGNSYWEAILNQGKKSGSSSSIWDWLPYLPYIFGQK